METGQGVVPRIFLSHSHKDNVFCERLVDFLIRAGADVWVDFKDLHTDKDMSEMIGQEIRGRPIFIVTLSPSAMKSPWVKREVGLATSPALGADAPFVILVIADPLQLKDFEGVWAFLLNHHLIGASDKLPDFVGVASRKVLVELKTGMPNAARYNWKEVYDDPVLVTLEGGNTNVGVLIKQGNDLLGRSDLEQAALRFRQATELAPFAYDAWFYLGVALDRLNQRDEAHVVFERAQRLAHEATASHPELWRLWYNLGEISYYLGQPSEALSAFERALDLMEIPIRFRMLPSPMGRFEARVAALQNAGGPTLQIAPIWYLKGRDLFARKDFEGAAKAFERISPEILPQELPPRDYWFLLGRAYLRQKGDDAHNKATANLERAVMVEADNAEAWSELGFARGEGQPAVEALQQALEIDPHLLLTRRQLTIVLAQMQRTDQAIATLDAGLKLKNDPPTATRLLGEKIALLLAAKRGRAVAETSEQLATLTKSDKDWMNAGEYYERLPDYPSAERTFEAALVSNPKNRQARDSLARVREKRRQAELAELRATYQQQKSDKRLDAAAATMEQISNMTKSADDWAELATIQTQVKQFDRAESSFDEAIRAESTAPQWRIDKAVLLAQRAKEASEAANDLTAQARQTRRQEQQLYGFFARLRRNEENRQRKLEAAELAHRADALDADANVHRQAADRFNGRAKLLRGQAQRLQEAANEERIAQTKQREAERYEPRRYVAHDQLSDIERQMERKADDFKASAYRHEQRAKKLRQQVQHEEIP